MEQTRIQLLGYAAAKIESICGQGLWLWAEDINHKGHKGT